MGEAVAQSMRRPGVGGIRPPLLEGPARHARCAVGARMPLVCAAAHAHRLGRLGLHQPREHALEADGVGHAADAGSANLGNGLVQGHLALA